MRKTTIEQYVEIIYILEEKEGHAHTGNIADIMQVKAPSVSEMLRKLEKKGYVYYKSYKGAKLTKKGVELAKKLQERHKTLAEFLNLIGVDEKFAEIDACNIEHYITEQSMEKLIKFLSFIKESSTQSFWLKDFEEFLKSRVKSKRNNRKNPEKNS